MNSRNICGALMFMLFLFAFPVQSRPYQELNVRSERSLAYILTNTTPDPNKLSIKFCVLRECPNKQSCYCCLTQKPDQLCYYKLDECRAVCPNCDPICPPIPSPSA
ncbi:hypothetical protein BDA96_10G013400 [Sorghum bicolor]|uniref:Bowman-Birk serine protease inhibitors family domain-containing protein n=2 Tax=Sorghum bicolor TaxID=4558 RepID=A0A921TZ89_SORBI|nr:hypothetical protein BDA96_10G013400 [Sorghum bicolor]KXG19149.1 hypothetical protein SORBI_3010G011300 [Sorghum bicolor]